MNPPNSNGAVNYVFDNISFANYKCSFYVPIINLQADLGNIYWAYLYTFFWPVFLNS